MSNPSVNRYLKNKTFDHIDHALGRPIQPLKDSHRNYFAIGAKCEMADQFRASPYWEEGRGMGDMTSFYVNEAGRKALDDHLTEIGDQHRLYEVMVKDYDGQVYPSEQVAKTRSGAKYQWLIGCDSDDPFNEVIQRIVSVRTLTPKRPLTNQQEGERV
ncbi:hypothetical protein [Cohaesibacter celericrescens]|uniref:hypothetical protein n=1 Tax=Cohaesibacter celericrescens TaxID=2067669 RepID=UPI0015E0A484|nr:hypothetical protein [Cohaesibacter celericrescens]